MAPTRNLVTRIFGKAKVVAAGTLATTDLCCEGEVGVRIHRRSWRSQAGSSFQGTCLLLRRELLANKGEGTCAREMKRNNNLSWRPPETSSHESLARQKSLLRERLRQQICVVKEKLESESTDGAGEAKLVALWETLELKLVELEEENDEAHDKSDEASKLASVERKRRDEAADDLHTDAFDSEGEAKESTGGANPHAHQGKPKPFKSLKLETAETKLRDDKKKEDDAVRKDVRDRTTDLVLQLQNQIFEVSSKMSDMTLEKARRNDLASLLEKLRSRLHELQSVQAANLSKRKAAKQARKKAWEEQIAAAWNSDTACSSSEFGYGEHGQNASWRDGEDWQSSEKKGRDHSKRHRIGEAWSAGHTFSPAVAKPSCAPWLKDARD
eukprot:TRINITY_DN4127_c0_g1_i1.p1 TRINITY_DN4127_c0_g1~~TRINITY_DN4127_c0_g1_i1.p1  ORF type:complete len:384 (-),score=76.02 TRINITY_DN4127_c0_g1_i1:243-1394(-)